MDTRFFLLERSLLICFLHLKNVLVAERVYPSQRGTAYLLLRRLIADLEDGIYANRQCESA